VVGTPFVALRFSNIMDPDDYQAFPSMWADPHSRKWNLWGYVDGRDVASACRLSLTAPSEALAGSPGLIIAAADTVMNRPSAALFGECSPVCRSLATSGSSRRCSPSTAPARSSATNPVTLGEITFPSPDCSRCDVTGSSPSTRSIDPWPSSSDK